MFTISGKLAALALMMVAEETSAADTMEAIGAEKCGGRVKTYEVEFLAPNTATVQATAKVVLNGLTVTAPNAATLSIDGRACTNARCPFEAKKGQTYKLVAASALPRFDELCIVVARP